jgi:hypothetical protein
LAYFLKGAVCILVGSFNSGDEVSFASVSKGEYFLEIPITHYKFFMCTISLGLTSSIDSFFS